MKFVILNNNNNYYNNNNTNNTVPVRADMHAILTVLPLLDFVGRKMNGS